MNQSNVDALKQAGLSVSADQLVTQLMSAHGQKETLRTLAKLSGIYTDAPPTWSEFKSSPDFMGASLGGIYPTWDETLSELYPNPFYSAHRQIVLGGAIGIGKTTCALGGIAYDMCRMLYMKDPHKTFKLIRSTKIVLAIMNATQKLAYGVNYEQLMQWFMDSPFFRSKIKAAEGSPTLFPNNIGIVVGSRSGSFLGQATFQALIDEANFMDKVHGQAEDGYDAIKSRMESRFPMSAGNNPGKIWVCSSKTDKAAFVEEYIVKPIKQTDDPTAKIYEYHNWEVLNRAGKLPLCGKTFKVFIGDDTKDPFVVQSKDQVIGLDDSKFIDVPTELHTQFSTSLHKSLQELAGVSTQATYRFMTSSEKIDTAMVIPNPMHREVIKLDFFNDSDQIINYMDYSKIPVDSRPRFVHIDLGLVNDKTGISAVRLDGVKTLTRFDPVSGRSNNSSEPLFRQDFLVMIEATPGQEVPIFKIKQFLIDLRNRGYPIHIVTTDGYQSTNLRQDLTYNGFYTELQSVDRTIDPYLELKSAIMEGRARLVDHPILRTEIRELQRTGGKIDHPTHGSKDGSDSLCGALWAAKKSMANTMSNVTVDDYLKSIDEIQNQNAYNSIINSAAQIKIIR